MKIDGRTALVTGASGGIGGAIARSLDRAGADLVIAGRREEELERLRRELGPRTQVVIGDLADSEGLERIANAASNAEIVVSCAGLPASGTVDDFTPDQIARAVRVNLTAPIELSRASIGAMRDRGVGHLVFVSSLAGKIPAPGSAIYNGTKAALRLFSLSMRDDLRGTGIGTTVIYPGFVAEAGMWAETGLRPPPGIRTRTPEQIAAAVIRGIERNRAEIAVAPFPLRLTAVLSGFAPRLVLSLNRRAGYQAIADGLAVANRAKR